jgi:competence protein ComEC
VLSITFINVGYGESILIELAADESKSVILIDGGSAEDEEYSGSSGRIRTTDYLAKKNIGVLDLAVITHAHEDHICGLEQFLNAGGRIQKLITVRMLPQNARELCAGENTSPSTRKFIEAMNSYVRLLAALRKQGVPVTEVDSATGIIPLASGLDARVIAPSFEQAQKLFKRYSDLYNSFQSPSFMEEADALSAELNDFSLALMLSYQGKKLFFPGDAVPETLMGDDNFQDMLASGALGTHILKLAHHGQVDGVTEEFIKATSPEIIITCSSSDRRYNSAHPDVYKRIETWLQRKPVYLFTDNINIEAKTLCRVPHSAAIITIGKNKEGEICVQCE